MIQRIFVFLVILSLSNVHGDRYKEAEDLSDRKISMLLGNPQALQDFDLPEGDYEDFSQRQALPWITEITDLPQGVNYVTDFIFLCPNLRRLDLFNKGLEGPVSADIGRLEHLNYIDLRKNVLTGFDGTLFESAEDTPREITLKLDGNPLQYFYAPSDENVTFFLGELGDEIPCIKFDGKYFRSKRDFSRFADILENEHIQALPYSTQPFEIRFCGRISLYLQSLGFQETSRIRLTRHKETSKENIKILGLKKKKQSKKNAYDHSRHVAWVQDLILKNAISSEKECL